MTHGWRATGEFSAVTGGWEPATFLCRAASGKQKGLLRGGGKGKPEQKDLRGSHWPVPVAPGGWHPVREGKEGRRPPAPRRRRVPQAHRLSFCFHPRLSPASLFFTALFKLWGSAGWKCSLFRGGAVAFGFLQPQNYFTMIQSTHHSPETTRELCW